MTAVGRHALVGSNPTPGARYTLRGVRDPKSQTDRARVLSKEEGAQGDHNRTDAESPQNTGEQSGPRES